MLVHKGGQNKGGQINNVQLITGVKIAEMSQLQNCSVVYTEWKLLWKWKKLGVVGGIRGDVYKEWKLLWKGKKMKKTKLYGHSGRVGEAFEKIKNKLF